MDIISLHFFQLQTLIAEASLQPLVTSVEKKDQSIINNQDDYSNDSSEEDIILTRSNNETSEGAYPVVADRPEAINVLYDFEEKYYIGVDIPDYDFYEYTYNIDQVKNENFVGYPVKILANVASISEIIREEITTPITGKVNYSVFNITIQSKNNSKLDVVELSCDLFYRQIKELFESNQLALFCGTIIPPYDKKHLSYSFYLRVLRTTVRSYDLLNDRDYALDEIKMKVDYYSQQSTKGIRGYIKDTLIKELGIQGIEHSPDLSKAIDFMILQSLSFGKSNDGRYSNKLHSLIIGAPASGKQLLTKVARVLNPIFYEASSSAAKITAAGLVGTVVNRRGINISKPGLFPLACHGVLCIQDFHEIARRDNDLWGIFSEVMENGSVLDSTSAKTKHQAITSVHVDMNRLSQVIDKQQDSSYKDLNIPINILSRFDFIMEIPSDEERQKSIALAMINDGMTLGSSTNEFYDLDWEIRIRRMIVYLSTKFNSVKFDKPTTAHFRNQLAELIERYENDVTVKKYLTSMMTRLEISLEKFIKTIACAERSQEVKTEYIDEAFEFIKYKLEFLRNFDQSKTKANTLTKDDKIQLRRNGILETLSGKELKKQEIYDLLSDSLKLSRKMIDRDLNALEAEGKIIHNQHGKWEFPEIKGDENISI